MKKLEFGNSDHVQLMQQAVTYDQNGEQIKYAQVLCVEKKEIVAICSSCGHESWMKYNKKDAYNDIAEEGVVNCRIVPKCRACGAVFGNPTL